jgi:uncharacterized cupin superfamily protein
MNATPSSPVLTLADVVLEDGTRDARYGSRWGALAPVLGLKHLGVSYDVIAPGHRICPFHCHHANDEFYVVLEGRGTYRNAQGEFPVQAGDVIGAPAGGRDTAHQIINTSDADLRLLVMSSMREPDVCEYPDSDKFAVMAGPEGARTFRHIGRKGDAVDYYLGEE